MISEFHRMRRLPPYVFAVVNAMKLKARQEGADIIDFGMGNPDQPTPQHIVDKLREVASDPSTHGYSVSRGIPGLRKAKAAYYQRRFGVDVDFDSEVIVTIGSKEGLANLAGAITRPGDIILVPNPSYPIHEFGFVIVDASVRYLPKYPEPMDFMSNLRKAVKHSNPKPIALVLNYPCNPTAETCTLDFYEEVVDFCLFHNIYIISDLAYCEIYFEDNPPCSILQVKKAREIAIEFTTMSKTYNMAGWRIGFAVGNKKLVAALAKIKSYLDYGAFTPIQVAAAHALNGPQECVEKTRKVYRERRDVLVDSFNKAGWAVPSPEASMFAWSPLPEPYQALGSLGFCKLLLKEADVAVAPGIGFGEYGDDYVRIALVENKKRIRQAAANIKAFLKQDPGEVLAKHRVELGL